MQPYQIWHSSAQTCFYTYSSKICMFQVCKGGQPEVMFRKDGQINTKMFFVKTKQETVWLFLFAGLVGCGQDGNMWRQLRSDMFRTLFIIFIGVSLLTNQLQNMCDARKRNFEWMFCCLCILSWNTSWTQHRAVHVYLTLSQAGIDFDQSDQTWSWACRVVILFSLSDDIFLQSSKKSFKLKLLFFLFVNKYVFK